VKALIPTVWSREAEVAAYEALAGLPWSEWGCPLLHGREYDDYGPGLTRALGRVAAA
jgi:hypothetical protein